VFSPIDQQHYEFTGDMKVVPRDTISLYHRKENLNLREGWALLD